MCGIVGVSRLNRDSKDELNSSLEDLAHRGPDMSGLIEKGPIHFGHVRLSIQDTSEGAKQPFVSNDGRFIMVFNGEIYNHLKLREEYLKGVSFRTQSDTETLIELYAKKGVECFPLLVGMFAFAIYDDQSGETVLCRDTFGIKPLYYWRKDEKVIFASELKVFRNFREVEWKLDRDELSHYFTFQTTSLDGSLIKDVSQLLPGHYINIGADRFVLNSFEAAKFSEKIERSTIDTVVKDRLLSDVPLGVFLSGGVDSSIISVLSNSHQKNVKCITLGFSEDDFDESTVASETAKTHNLNHSVENIDIDEFKNDLIETISRFDCPSADGLNTYLVSKAAKQAGLTVALSGLGADEIFGGYSSFRNYERAQKVNRLGVLRYLILFLLRSFNFRGKLYDLVEEKNMTPVGLTALMRQTLGMGHLKSLIKEYRDSKIIETKERLDELTKHDSDAMTKVSKAELYVYTIPLLLRDTDQASMLNSMEIRVPFLDHRLVKASFEQTGVRSSKEKGFLKDLFKDILGEKLSARPKTGFVLPWDNWFKSELKDLIVDTICSLSEQELIDYSKADKEFNKYLNGKSRLNSSFWLLLLSLNVWLKSYKVEVK